MRSWLILLGGLFVWAAHFFALYGIGEFAGTGTAPRFAALLLTAFGLAIDVFLAWSLLRHPPADAFGCWRTSVALGGVFLSALALIWQGLPVLIQP